MKEIPQGKTLSKKRSKEYITLEYPASVRKNLKDIVLPDEEKIPKKSSKCQNADNLSLATQCPNGARSDEAGDEKKEMRNASNKAKEEAGDGEKDKIKLSNKAKADEGDGEKDKIKLSNKAKAGPANKGGNPQPGPWWWRDI